MIKKFFSILIISTFIIMGCNSLVFSKEIDKSENVTQNKYAIILGDTSNDEWTRDLTKFSYKVLCQDYCFTDENIYVLCSTNPLDDDEELEEIVDGPCWGDGNDHQMGFKESIQEISGKIKSDDILFIIVLTHGLGYHGPDLVTWGYCGYTNPIINDNDPDDDKDYLERDF